MAVCFCGGSLYLNGFCVTPTEWKSLNPSHKAPKKHKAQTPEQDAVTVDAFHPDTVAQVAGVRSRAQATHELHLQNW